MPSYLETGYVYFVQSTAEPRLIKIGYTAFHPDRRFEALSKTSPVPLRKLGVLRGDPQEELSLHDLFDDYREHGEWFRPAPTLTQYVKRVAKRWPAPEAAAKRQRAYLRSVNVGGVILAHETEYCGYIGHADYCRETGRYHGRLVGLDEEVCYEAREKRGLVPATMAAVEEYLERCRADGRKPKVSPPSANLMALYTGRGAG